jgi:acetyltransferase-like isoleucine patch superfamily enzyme
MVIQDTAPWTVYAGNPATVVKDREISNASSSFNTQLSSGSAEAK